ncbi:unnamed protein product [Nyctereutes procyonoides]|uniref:(raccoon dog) hypothetical protein n=1 Tax=Nyctereutes procyonoides TaxID=34880 RepID=A0A811XWR4_NYCPR|nr:unnamed protein product [Nyctereutes procyonoides]
MEETMCVFTAREGAEAHRGECWVGHELRCGVSYGEEDGDCDYYDDDGYDYGDDDDDDGGDDGDSDDSDGDDDDGDDNSDGGNGDDVMCPHICGRGPGSDAAQPCNLRQGLFVWASVSPSV